MFFCCFCEVMTLVELVKDVSDVASPLPPSFLNTYGLSMSSLGCKAFCIVINFLVLWSICLSSFLIHFKNDPEYQYSHMFFCSAFKSHMLRCNTKHASALTSPILSTTLVLYWDTDADPMSHKTNCFYNILTTKHWRTYFLRFQYFNLSSYHTFRILIDYNALGRVTVAL